MLFKMNGINRRMRICVWDVTLCRWFTVPQPLEGTLLLHLQGLRCPILLGHFSPWRWRQYVSSNGRGTPVQQHSASRRKNMNLEQNVRGTLKSRVTFRFKLFNQQDATVSQVYYLTFMSGSAFFGRPHAHHQEHTTALGASGFTVREQRLERCWSWSSRLWTYVEPHVNVK